MENRRTNESGLKKIKGLRKADGAVALLYLT